MRKSWTFEIGIWRTLTNSLVPLFWKWTSISTPPATVTTSSVCSSAAISLQGQTLDRHRTGQGREQDRFPVIVRLELTAFVGREDARERPDIADGRNRVGADGGFTRLAIVLALEFQGP